MLARTVGLNAHTHRDKYTSQVASWIKAKEHRQQETDIKYANTASLTHNHEAHRTTKYAPNEQHRKPHTEPNKKKQFAVLQVFLVTD